MNVQRFDFTRLRDFREPPMPLEMMNEPLSPEPKEELPPPPPTFSEAEMATAKKIAFEEGRQAGMQEGLKQADTESTQREQQIEAGMKLMVKEAMMLRERHQALMVRQCDELSQLVLMIARKVAGDFIQTMPEASVLTMIRDCLHIMVHQPKIMLVVHPSIAELLQKRVSRALEQMDADSELKVLADESLDPAEGRLEWKDGMASRDLGAIWQQIETMLHSVNFAALAHAPEGAAKQVTAHAAETNTPNNQERESNQ